MYLICDCLGFWLWLFWVVCVYGLNCCFCLGYLYTYDCNSIDCFILFNLIYLNYYYWYLGFELFVFKFLSSLCFDLVMLLLFHVFWFVVISFGLLWALNYVFGYVLIVFVGFCVFVLLVCAAFHLFGFGFVVWFSPLSLPVRCCVVFLCLISELLVFGFCLLFVLVGLFGFVILDDLLGYVCCLL